MITVFVDGRLAGLVNVEDTLRAESVEAIGNLEMPSISRTLLIIGDGRAVREKIGSELGVSETICEALPERKLEVIRGLQALGHRVAFIEDGVNDAPALAAADVGVAMGSIGTAVALETADIVLLTDDVGQVPYIIELSQATLSTIRWNIVISMTIVPASVGDSALGLIGSVIGAIMHEVVAVPVIANAARLISRKPKNL